MSGISKIIVAITAVIVAAIGFSIWQTLATAGYGTLDLSVAPSDATVKVDGHGSRPAGKIELAPGTHTLELSHKDYASQTIQVTVTGGATTTKGVILVKTGGPNPKLNEQQTAQAEGQAGKIIEQEGNKVTAQNPLIAKLPYYGQDFNIDVGVSKKYPGDPTAVAIYITIGGPQAKTHALEWIKAQGFNPDAYEIIYLNPQD
jgi:hypothetical protein